MGPLGTHIDSRYSEITLMFRQDSNHEEWCDGDEVGQRKVVPCTVLIPFANISHLLLDSQWVAHHLRAVSDFDQSIRPRRRLICIILDE